MAAGVRHWIRASRRDIVEPRCFTFACPCTAVRALGRALPGDVAYTTVVTPYGGVADWRYGVGAAVDDADVVRVTASHTGLVASPDTWAAIARHLAGAGRARAGRAGGVPGA